MAALVSEPAGPGTRPRRRLWLAFGGFVAGSLVLGAISDWRNTHLILINT
jgi:conjugal transfer pilin signal peptidase TrbI